MFLLTEIHYQLSRALGKSMILVLAAVMLVISMRAYMSNLQAQQAALDHLADSVPVTARVMNRAGTQSARVFIDTERYDVLAGIILAVCTGITVSDSLWILLVYMLCASTGIILAILRLMRFDTLSQLTQSN